MAELALAVTGHYRDLDRDLVLLGVLFHDLGKTRELGAMPANDYTLEGRLVGHVVIGRDLLRECCLVLGDVPDDLQLHLEHLVLSHHGRREFAAPVEPMTPEALVLHFIDDLDSKLSPLDQARREGPGVQWSRGLNRYVYLASRDGEEGGDAAEPPTPAGDRPGEEDADELPVPPAGEIGGASGQATTEATEPEDVLPEDVLPEDVSSEPDDPTFARPRRLFE
jgi:hypothetical protein